jgi:cell wall assembly regulator SMI1
LIEDAIARVKTYAGRKHFVGGRDSTAIQEAESALGIRFPPSYRAFLQAFGAGSVRGREIYGILDGDYQDSAIPDGIWLTLQERQSSGLPESLVIVHSTGDGDYVAIDTSQRRADGENPMVLWSAGSSAADGDLEQVSPDFGTFFLELVLEATA